MARHSIQTLERRRRQVDGVELLRIDQGHLGQGERIEAIGLRVLLQIPAQSRHLTRLDPYHFDIGMLRTQIEAREKPSQPGGFHDHHGCTAWGIDAADVLLKLLQAYR